MKHFVRRRLAASVHHSTDELRHSLMDLIDDLKHVEDRLDQYLRMIEKMRQ